MQLFGNILDKWAHLWHICKYPWGLSWVSTHHPVALDLQVSPTTAAVPRPSRTDTPTQTVSSKFSKQVSPWPSPPPGSGRTHDAAQLLGPADTPPRRVEFHFCGLGNSWSAGLGGRQPGKLENSYMWAPMSWKASSCGMDEGVFQVMGENLLTSWEGPGKNLANPSGSGASKPWALGRPRKSGVSNHGVCSTQSHFCKSGGSSEWWVFYFFKLNLPYPLKQLFCILKSTNLMVNFLSSSHSQ